MTGLRGVTGVWRVGISHYTVPMIDPELSLTVLTGLAAAVYAFVVVVTTTVPPIRLAVGAVGFGPFVWWVFGPHFFDFAEIALPPGIRRPALVLIGLAIATRYASVRSNRVGARGLRIAAVTAAALFWVGVGVSTANLLLAATALLPAFASGSSSIPRAELSGGESRSQRLHQQDSE